MNEENDIDEGADYSEPFGSRTCSGCGESTIGESCGFCGNDLCPECFEMGGGFCSSPHSQEMIWAYEDANYPPANEVERQARVRQRQAHVELIAIGILPPHPTNASK